LLGIAIGASLFGAGSAVAGPTDDEGVSLPTPRRGGDQFCVYVQDTTLETQPICVVLP
jgi:hypothetical protein